ncbi:hypothetical protein PR048_006917 [Dryococelus australis]|uniref:Uncharacterized protein n=1 Tax=Dryococelus australis TaxID=614101 RepID=A0ABQ9IC96_9NEOP|nr:hypothetical protein PR048_006917 [Dryococelus australis]
MGCSSAGSNPVIPLFSALSAQGHSDSWADKADRDTQMDTDGIVLGKCAALGSGLEDSNGSGDGFSVSDLIARVGARTSGAMEPPPKQQNRRKGKLRVRTESGSAVCDSVSAHTNVQFGTSVTTSSASTLAGVSAAAGYSGIQSSMTRLRCSATMSIAAGKTPSSAMTPSPLIDCLSSTGALICTSGYSGSTKTITESSESCYLSFVVHFSDGE